jgi:large subunit ribosomal protein L3
MVGMGIIGKKLGMTQIFNEQGQQIPVTVIEATPNPVVAVTDRAKVGYAGVQLGLGTQRLARDSKKGERTPRGVRAHKAQVGHAKKAGLETPPRVLRSFRLDDPANAKHEVPTYSVGDVIKVDLFQVGEMVKVTGTSKGRGFQGVVKRHGFHGGPNTHGTGSRARSARAPIRRASSRARRCRASTATCSAPRLGFVSSASTWSAT